MKRYIILFFMILFLISYQIEAQEIFRLSLNEAVEYAMRHNYDVKKSVKDIEAAKQQVKERMAYGLPQFNGALEYKDNVARPVSLLPGEFVGKPGEDVEIQFGTRYNMNFGGELTQLIFSSEYMYGLKASKKFFEKTNIDFFKNRVAIKKQVSDWYVNVLATREALGIIDSTLKTTEKLYNETKQIVETGMAEDTDADQLELLVENLKASKTKFENQLGVTEAFLKFYLGMNINDKIILTDSINTLIEQRKSSLLVKQDFDYHYNPDFVSLSKRKEISAIQIKLARSGYYPSLVGKAFANTNAQRESWNFFNTKERWFFSAYWGITLNIPVLSGGERAAKVKQAQIAFEQITIAEQQLSTQLQLQYQTLKNDYINALRVLENKEKNRKVAEKIYKKTREKYINGMVGSLDILNTHNQYLTAENDFVTASLNFLKAAEALETILTKFQKQ
jgi:outer membrane protein TolC